MAVLRHVTSGVLVEVDVDAAALGLPGFEAVEVERPKVRRPRKDDDE